MTFSLITHQANQRRNIQSIPPLKNPLYRLIDCWAPPLAHWLPRRSPYIAFYEVTTLEAKGVAARMTPNQDGAIYRRLCAAALRRPSRRASSPPRFESSACSDEGARCDPTKGSPSGCADGPSRSWSRTSLKTQNRCGRSPSSPPRGKADLASWRTPRARRWSLLWSGLYQPDENEAQLFLFSKIAFFLA